MLYCPAALEFSDQVIVFVHIPKTAGSALGKSLFDSLGAQNCLVTNEEKIGKVLSSAVHKHAWAARQGFRQVITRIRQRDPLLPSQVSQTEADAKYLLEGHFALGHEPQRARQPVYITALRDPVDRFLSEFYFRHDLLAAKRPEKSKRHEFRTFSLDQYVDYLFERQQWTVTNIQCAYLAGIDDLEAAKASIDQRVFLAIPSHRLDDGIALLRPVLNRPIMGAPQINVGSARQGQPPPSERTLGRIRALVLKDQQLFDYASTEFDILFNAAKNFKISASSRQPAKA